MSQGFTDDCFASGHVAQTDMQNIENNFAAVKSLFSGSAAPDNLVAGMPWFDTDTDQLYIRNKDNNQWLSLGFAPGTVMLFGQNSAPLGWTRKSNWQDNAMLCYAASGNIGSGGSANPQSAHNHSGGTIPNHSHNLDIGSGSGSLAATGERVWVSSEGGIMYPSLDIGSGTFYPVYAKTESGGGGGSTGNTGYNTAPYYQEVIAATKD